MSMSFLYQLEIEVQWHVFNYLQGDGYILTDEMLFKNPTNFFLNKQTLLE